MSFIGGRGSSKTDTAITIGPININTENGVINRMSKMFPVILRDHFSTLWQTSCWRGQCIISFCNRKGTYVSSKSGRDQMYTRKFKANSKTN